MLLLDRVFVSLGEERQAAGDFFADGGMLDDLAVINSISARVGCGHPSGLDATAASTRSIAIQISKAQLMPGASTPSRHYPSIGQPRGVRLTV
jgi:hypothetical protein